MSGRGGLGGAGRAGTRLRRPLPVTLRRPRPWPTVASSAPARGSLGAAPPAPPRAPRSPRRAHESEALTAGDAAGGGGRAASAAPCMWPPPAPPPPPPPPCPRAAPAPRRRPQRQRPPQARRCRPRPAPPTTLSARTWPHHQEPLRSYGWWAGAEWSPAWRPTPQPAHCCPATMAITPQTPRPRHQVRPYLQPFTHCPLHSIPFTATHLSSLSLPFPSLPFTLGAPHHPHSCFHAMIILINVPRKYCV